MIQLRCFVLGGLAFTVCGLAVPTDTFAQTERSPTIVRCDELAANPLNPDNPAAVSGVAYADIDASQAIGACKKATIEHPDEPRMNYQLGRALDSIGQKKLALTEYFKAADLGYRAAQFNLGAIYRDRKNLVDRNQDAASLFLASALQGYAPAQFNLGLMYEKGRGMPPSDAEAVYWYQLAADQGYRNGEFNLGWMYEYGRGVPQDYEMAAEWYSNAADGGHPSAMYRLGVLYEEGQGVSADYSEALVMFNRAAGKGETRGLTAAGRLHLDGLGTPRDVLQAAVLFRTAAAKGDRQAAKRLQLLYSDKNAAAELQRKLQSRGYYHGKIDGAFGRGSQAALGDYCQCG